MVVRGEMSVVLNSVVCENHLAGLYPWKFWFSGSPWALSSCTSFTSSPGEIYPKNRWYHIQWWINPQMKRTRELPVKEAPGGIWGHASLMAQYGCISASTSGSGCQVSPFRSSCRRVVFMEKLELHLLHKTLLCLPYPTSVNLSLSAFLCSFAVDSCLHLVFTTFFKQFQVWEQPVDLRNMVLLFSKYSINVARWWWSKDLREVGRCGLDLFGKTTEKVELEQVFRIR